MDNGTPIAADRAVFVADAHLNRDDDDTRAFVAVAERAAAENTALFLLGDIFDLWFGAPGLTFGFQEPVIARLRELRRHGLRLYYAEGNRDFYLKKAHEGTTFDGVSEGAMRASVGPFRLHLSHGDEVNRADLFYRFWKGLSKNAVAYGLLSLVPRPVALPLTMRMERTLRQTNLRFKGAFPERECRDFAARRFGEGIDFVILGHFHREFLVPPAGDEPPKVLAILPSWREGRRHFYVTAAGDFGFRPFRPGEPLIP
ncbi:MAG: UDP-2,3-diacylglucosamine diphosphatase [Gemmatimonadota bacterium]